MNDPALHRRAPSPAARAGHSIVRGLLVVALILGALVLSVVASVRGFTAALVVAAVVALAVIRTHNQARRPSGRPATGPPQRS